MTLFGPLISLMTRLRWILTHPLEIKALPKMIPVIPLPYLKDLSYITIGEILLILPLLFLVLQGYALSFVTPDLDKSGQVASYAMYLTFLTANKSNNLVSLILGISFDRLIPLHQLCGMVAVVLGCFHTYAAFQFGGANLNGAEDSIHTSFGTDPSLIKFLGDGTNNLTGSLLVASLFASVVLSIVPLRRFAFQLWLYSHIIFAITAVVVSFLHDVTTVVFVMLWWALDLTIRYLLMAGWRNQAEADLELLVSAKDDRQIVQITFPKPQGFDYVPGQFVQVAIPAVSMFQFHPVSISSAPHEDKITLYFRGMGDWTNALVELAKTKKQTLIMLEGPFGSLAIDLEDRNRYKTVLLVGGGIGNTVCESVGKALLHQHEAGELSLTKLRYVWAVRKLAMVHDMPPLGGCRPNIAYAAGISTAHDFVEIDVYCTRGEEEFLDCDEDLFRGDENLFRVHQTRPDFDVILEEIKQVAIEADESNVAVIACGPPGMVDVLREACRKHSSMVVGCAEKVVFFDLHTERFEF